MKFNRNKQAFQTNAVKGIVEATGGTISTYTSGTITYKVHTFTSSGDFIISNGGVVEYLIVASGAATAENQGNGRWGGGGAGGLLSGSSAVSAQNYSISVGGSVTSGDYGNNSTALGLTAIRGARGANFDSQELTGLQAGGSGGGAWYPLGVAGGKGTPGQGYDGGPGGTEFPYGGGGGGAGSAGRDRNYNSGNNGGDGLSSSISGSSVVYAAGSRCSIYGSPNFSFTASTYGGGAGGGGASGQGVVIIRYPI
jgi:hypothetical protein